MDKYNLERFVDAQNGVFDTVLYELRAGKKESHWMWFVFPQLKELGRGRNSEYYGIENIDEARAYLAHPVLRERLETCFQILLDINESNPVRIFGNDHQKLHSSATLFSIAEPENEIFQKVIDKFWAVEDFETANILERG